MVAILAITGRFNLRTTGRAVMFLTVKKASDIATPEGALSARPMPI
jgi:hypothetical protein